MKSCLIGYTGFVGSNLLHQLRFDDCYNSKNIDDIKGKSYETIICAGVRAEKYIANKYPERDLEGINKLIQALKKAKCEKFVLISTIDVYSSPDKADESTTIDKTNLHPYGRNRLYLEEWVKSNFSSSYIIRLPALFGNGLKKNFIYDCMTKVPKMIAREKFVWLTEKDKSGIINNSYKIGDNGFFHFSDDISEESRENLINVLDKLNFTSLVFTDSRSTFPFYDLRCLSEHIKVILENDIDLVNLANEPISAKEIAKKVFGFDFTNEIPGRDPVKYDIKTVHDKIFGGENGYIYDKQTVLGQISGFVGAGR